MGATSSSIRAGGAYVELFGKDNQLVSFLNKNKKRLEAFGKSIAKVGAGITAMGAAIRGPLIAAAHIFADMGSNLHDMSQRTGASVEALSELGFAAKLSGSDVESLEGGLKKMQKFMGSGKEAEGPLGQLGLQLKDLQGLAPEDQFTLIADRLDRISDPGTKAALAMKIFGKNGTALLPMMENGAAGIKKMREEAERLGITMSKEDADAADNLGDALDTLWAVVKAGVFQVGAAMAPAMQELTKTMTECAATVVHWIKDNRALIVTVGKIALGVIAAGMVVTALGVAIAGLGTVLGIVASALTAIGVVIGFLVSPVGLLIAGLVAAGFAFFKFTEAGQQSLVWLAQQFAAFKQIALDTFGGIADALSSGDIALAAKILWLGLKLAWAQGVSALLDIWNSIVQPLQETYTQIKFGLAGAFIDAAAMAFKAWATFSAELKKLMIDAIQFVVNLHIAAEGAIMGKDTKNLQMASDTMFNMVKVATDAKKQGAIDNIEAARKGAQDQLPGQANAENEARRKANEKAAADAQAEIDKAKAELATATAAAKAGARPPGLPDMERRKADLEGAVGEVKSSASGTFNAAAVGGIGGGIGGKIDKTNNLLGEVKKAIEKGGKAIFN